jgi:hypothetical protein
MQPDLESLYITQEELKDLTGISKRDLKAYQELTYPRPALLLHISLYAERILLLGWGLIPLGYLIKWSLFRKPLKEIFDEVFKYNAVVKAIDINDQLEAAGNRGAFLSNREKVIEALKLTREDLIRALKTERILRKNKRFLASNPEAIATNLTPKQALQVNEQASEHKRLLDEALQVAVGVQEEMRELEGRPN